MMASSHFFFLTSPWYFLFDCSHFTPCLSASTEDLVRNLLPIFLNWVVCLLGVDLCEFFIYFGDQTLVRAIIGKYYFPIWLVHFPLC